jgi:TolB-like protein
MISKAGIAIFLFGNKRDARGRIVLADGMREELLIARRMGLQIIAVGSTGWIAEEIANDLSTSLDGRSKAFKKAFATANDRTADIASTVKAILVMVGEYSAL